MQSIYAFKQNEESVYHLAIEKIQDLCYEWLLAIGKSEEEMVRNEEELAIKVFRSKLGKEKPLDSSIQPSEKALEIAEVGFVFFRSRRNSDNLYFGKRMLEETEDIYKQYLRLLNATVELSKVDVSLGLSDNQALKLLMDVPETASAIESAKLSQETLMQWNKLLKKDENIKTLFGQITANDLEADKEKLRTIVREFLFKNEIVVSYFEEDDINWTENKAILKSMVNHTIKGLGDGLPEETSLDLLSKNWEEDKAFFQKLYQDFFKHEDEFENMIAEKTKKWAPDRIASIDRILMIMAICEMVNFSSIPVKVTINEYIEISKVYSTPKSWQYINGMLDEISKTLVDSGIIRKTGRGLIDNK